MGKCVHAIPGRARFSSPVLRRDAMAARALARRLRSVVGVEAVDLRPGSGSIIVHFDPAQIHLDDLRLHVESVAPAASELASAVLQDVEGVPLPAVSRRARVAVTELASSPVVMGTVRHIGGVIRSTAFKVILEKAVHTGVRRILRVTP